MPYLVNDLPDDIQSAKTLDTFKSLKTHLFRLAYEVIGVSLVLHQFITLVIHVYMEIVLLHLIS